MAEYERKRWPVWLIAVVLLLGMLSVGVTGVGGWLLWRQVRGVRGGMETASERRDAVQSAFVTTHPDVTTGDAKEVMAGLDAFRKAGQRGDVAAIADHMDPDRMVDMLVELGAFPAMSGSDRSSFAVGFKKGLAKSPDAFAGLTWERADVRAIRYLRSDDVVVSLTLHWIRAGSSSVSHMRWWMHKSGGLWRVYDFDDVDTGVRYLVTIADAFHAGELSSSVMDVMGKFPAIRKSIEARDFYKAREQLKAIEAVSLPPRLDGIRWLLKGVVALRLMEYKDALKACEAAQSFNSDMPVLDEIRTQAYVGLKEYDKALAAAERFETQMGHEAVISLYKGLALQGKKRLEEAAAAFRAALEDNPDLIDPMWGLCQVLPAGKKAELSEYMRQTPHPKQMFAELAAKAVRVDDAETLEALLDGYRKAGAKGDPLADYYAAEIKKIRGDDAGAATLLQPLLAGVGDADRYVFYRQYVVTSLKAGDALATYAECPNRTLGFSLIAPELLAKRKFAALDALLARHAREVPGDLEIYRVRARRYEAEDNYVPADKAYAEGMAACSTEKERATFRWRWVDLRYRHGDVLGAYRDIGPDAEVFEQLAWRLRTDKKADLLAQLINVYTPGHERETRLSFWRAQLQFLRKDYAACIQAVQEAKGPLMEDRQYAYSTTDIYVRALIRTESYGQARIEAQEGAGKEKTSWPLLLACAAQGQEQAVLEQMQGLLSDDDYSVQDFYRDEDLGPMLREKLPLVRARYPEPPPATRPATLPYD